jgi:hypothetical protein
MGLIYLVFILLNIEYNNNNIDKLKLIIYYIIKKITFYFEQVIQYPKRSI